jgi:hypothetical protein
LARRWRPAVDGDCLFATMVAVAYLFARVRIEKARAVVATSAPDRP